MALQKLKIIGNGDAFGAGSRYQTCFYLESSDTKLLVDLGATAIHNLQQSVEINDINLIIISHLHGDHFGGIPFFLLNSAFLTKREDPLTIIGPRGSKARIKSLTEDLYKGITRKMETFELNFIEYQSGDPINFNDLEILALDALHSDDAESHCIRISSDHTRFAYSGDTEWTDNLIKISENADYFLCECTYYSTQREGHLNYLELFKKQQLFNAKKILLTHLGNEMLDEEVRKKVSMEYTTENNVYLFH